METCDAITARRNVRALEDRPLPTALLERILEASRRGRHRATGFPDDRHAAYLIDLGCAADRPLRIRNPNRRPFDGVVHWGRW
jgi:nitroreductase